MLKDSSRRRQEVKTFGGVHGSAAAGRTARGRDRAVTMFSSVPRCGARGGVWVEWPRPAQVGPAGFGPRLGKGLVLCLKFV